MSQTDDFLVPDATVARPWRSVRFVTAQSSLLTVQHMLPIVMSMLQPTVPPLIKPDGAAIRRIRESRRLSINRVAIHIGMTTAYLSRLERGQRGATLETLEKIAAAIGCELDAISYPQPW